MKNIIEQVAAQNGTTPAHVRHEIQAAIDAAWDNPAGRELQQLLFPNGQPSPEEFILTVAGQAQQRCS